MIRQLGPPIFFFTFTSVEQNWSALKNTLEVLHNSYYSSRQNDLNIGNETDKYQLIKKDPITCAQYYTR